jgi:hypothetical protein
MDIRFVSTLTSDDEEALAPGLVQAISSILDRLPIAYTIRVETTGARVFHHAHPALGHSLPVDDPVVSTGKPGAKFPTP